jgi:hypothetical protein
VQKGKDPQMGSSPRGRRVKDFRKWYPRDLGKRRFEITTEGRGEGAKQGQSDEEGQVGC